MTNAARIWKLYGTTGRKGDSTATRPHRKSGLFPSQPLDLANVPTTPREILANLADPLTPKQETANLPAPGIRRRLPATVATGSESSRRANWAPSTWNGT